MQATMTTVAPPLEVARPIKFVPKFEQFKPEPFKIEAKLEWPLQGSWTYQDYLRLPDNGVRYEIIDGVLHMANAPSYNHQYAVSEFHLQIGYFVKQRKLGVVLTAPFEIHLPGIAQPVQPDVFFIATERQPKFGAKLFEGAPDLVIEVTSPSTARLDSSVKLNAYQRAGVREYWLAHPRTRFVEVYALSAETHEYKQIGQFGAGEMIKSIVLPDLELAVDSIFVIGQ